MPSNLYECMFMLDTTKVAGDVPAAAKQLHAILDKHKAEILASRPWDERRLAYPIKGQKKALFYLTYFRVDTQNLEEIEHDIKLTEAVLRYMVLVIHPKLEETMLTLARDEHALALQAASDDGSEDEGGMGGGDREERRRPRRHAEN